MCPTASATRPECLMTDILSPEEIETLRAENRELKQRFEILTTELETSRQQFQTNMVEKTRLDNLLTRVLGHLGCGAITVDLDGNITFVNASAAELLGCAPHLALGQPSEGLLGECARLLKQAIRTGREVDGLEKTLSNAKGRSVPVRVSITCLYTDTGELQGALAAIEDMSRLQELSEQASRVSTLTALGEMSATIAHEIRNPLGGIGGFAGLLERDMEVDDPNRRLVKKIIEGVAGLNRMVTSLLNYTRPLQLNVRPVDAVEMVEDSLGFFEIDAGAHLDEVELQRIFPDTPLTCRADPEHIQQIMLNLLHNAVQAMPGSGRVTVTLADIDTREDARTQLNRPCVALTVADTGIGLPDDVKSKLFMPFFTTKEDGNGLGLATAKKVIEAHGGDIVFESIHTEGAAFTLYLPK
jgi:PAS domain S-box-containing protein